MEIIKLGKLEKRTPDYIFTCKNCECVFKASCNEYNYETSTWGNYYIAKCPCCGKKTSLREE